MQLEPSDRESRIAHQIEARPIEIQPRTLDTSGQGRALFPSIVWEPG